MGLQNGYKKVSWEGKMNITGISIFIVFLCVLSTYGSFSHSQEIVLCLNPVDKYVVALDGDGECLEEETQIIMSGKATANLKDLTPVAVFEDNDACETEGSVIKFGFDKNGNYELDEDELESTSRTCTAPEVNSE